MSNRTKVNGVVLKNDSDMVVRKFKNRGSFEPVTFKHWTRAAQSKGVMVDIGCYTGIYAIAAALAGCKVFAFDANPVALKRAVENAGLNNVQITTWNVALYSEKDVKALSFPNGRTLSSAVKVVEADKSKTTIMTDTLDSFDLKHVEAIKIDSERSEPHVLRGAIKTITESQPDIYIEQLDEETTRQIESFMHEVGYVCKQLDKFMFLWTPENKNGL